MVNCFRPKLKIGSMIYESAKLSRTSSKKLEEGRELKGKNPIAFETKERIRSSSKMCFYDKKVCQSEEYRMIKAKG